MEKEPYIKYKIVIIGAGGTGSHFIARFSQFLSNFNNMYTSVEVSIVDGDHVEVNNLNRQNFIYGDLQQNKASVIAQAVKETYDLDFKAFSMYIEELSDLDKLFSANSYSDGKYYTVVPILIGCCDNHRCRQVMENWFSNVKTGIYIDSANEYSTGEVVVGVKNNNVLISPSRKFYFPEVMRSRAKRKSEESCGVINVSTPQHIATNCEAANIILSIMCQILSGCKVPAGIIYFDAFEFTQVFRKYDGGEKD